MSAAAFKLSDLGADLAHDPTMLEYLRSYGFPCPPTVRYGYYRFESPRPNDRVSLLGQAWVPSHASGVVVLVHGYGEHAGNYARLVQDFVEQRYTVVAMDLRGHGLSEGPRGHLPDPDAYVEDLERFLLEVLPSVAPNSAVYLWGHSLGAMVGLQLLAQGKVKPRASVFSSPLLGLPEIRGTQKVLATLAPVMAKVLPSLPVAHGIPSNILSHDEEYLARRFEDPLIGKVSTPQWLVSIRAAVEELQNRADRFQKLSPTLLLLSGNELVTNLNEARKFAFRAYSGMQHKVIEFPGYFHELEKEKEIRPRVVSESVAWFRSHS